MPISKVKHLIIIKKYKIFHISPLVSWILYILFSDVNYKYLILISLVFSCAPEIKAPKPILLPPTKTNRPDLVEKTILSMGLITEYEVWEFLRSRPSEGSVIETLGLPDSVWLSDNDSTKFLYYFIDQIQDYNLIEINSTTNSVSGFEWD